MQGFAYAFYAAALWAPVAYVVPLGCTGTAYGIMTAALNCGTALFPLISAQIFSASGDLYLPYTEYFFTALAAIAAAIGVALIIIGELILSTVTFCANPANDLTCSPSYILI